MYDFIDDPLGLFKDDPDRFTPTADEARALARPRTLGGSYLFEALDAIRDAGSSDRLYTPAVRAAARRAREPGWVLTAQHDAAEQRIRFSRNAMLFAAFAAEAYINEFVAAHFAGKDCEAIEKRRPWTSTFSRRALRWGATCSLATESPRRRFALCSNSGMCSCIRSGEGAARRYSLGRIPPGRRR